jgi:hypothetical protein
MRVESRSTRQPGLGQARHHSFPPAQLPAAQGEVGGVVQLGLERPLEVSRVQSAIGCSCLSDKFRDSRKGSSGTDLCVDGDEVRDGLTWGRVASTNKVKSAEAHSTLLL